MTVPAYPTLAGLRRTGRLSSGWQSWFPFSANGQGRWAFSGRVALYHGVGSLGLPPQSTILVPAYHEGIELDALLAAGFRLRYYRVDHQLRVDFADIERRLDASVAALYVIHYFGIPQPLAALRSFCDARGLKLIEDCALALFSRSDQTWLGSVGDLAIFSLYKTLALPHGGYLVTRSHNGTPLRAPPLMSTFVQTLDLVHHTLQAGGWSGVERAATTASRFVRRLLRWNRDTTVSSGGPRWDARLVSYSASRWTRQLVGFTNPDRVVARRRANYERLASWLRVYTSIPFPELAPGVCPLLFPILVPNREQVRSQLQALGVESGNYWPAPHATCPADLAAEVAPWRQRCLELPIHQELSESDIDRVAKAVIEVLTRH